MCISLLSESSATAILEQPLELGLHKQLMEVSHSASHQHVERIYGCRHCLQVRNEFRQDRHDTAIEAHTTPVDPAIEREDNVMSDVAAIEAPEERSKPARLASAASTGKRRSKIGTYPKNVEKNVQLLDFNALRSHVKAK
jgi:hypothetical protein